MTDFDAVITAWDEDAKTGGRSIHPFPPDSPEFWDLGKVQAGQVRDYAAAGDRVVDFGAGIGRLTLPLAAMGFGEVIAVDSSTHMLDELERHASGAGIDPGILRLVHSHGPGLTDHIEPGSVDVVIARAVLIHHDYASIQTLVTVLAELLRPGGHLIADWPTGAPRERRDWVDVTRWHPHHRAGVARLAGLEPITVDTDPSIWRRTA